MHDTSIFEKNMAILREKHPEIASRVGRHDKDIYKYRVLKAKTGEPNVLIMRDLDHVMLYDNDNPFEHCKAYFEGLNIKSAPIVIFLGFGLGYHLYMFTTFFGDRLGTKKIIIFEEDVGLFRLALEMVDLQNLISHPDIHFFVGDDLEGAYIQIRKKIITEKGAFSFMRSPKVIPLPSHLLLNGEYYLEALNKTKRACRQVMLLAGNDPMDSFLGMDNMLMNIKNIVSTPGINLLFDRFKGMPGVTVASGPSLSKNLHLLKDIRERALIVCCDASLMPLMKRDIRPHIVITMERTDGTEFFYEKVPDFEGIYLAFCPLVRPKTFDSYKGKKFVVNRKFSHFNWLHLDKGTLNFGPSVGNMAFKVAEVLGCDPIIMIGQDLAFAEDGDTHVSEMVFGERDEYYHTNVLEVEGNDGRAVKTSNSWEVFKVHFEEDIEFYGGLCINATEGGAKIRGTTLMTFGEAIKRYCKDEFHPDSIIEEGISNFDKDIGVPKQLEEFRSRTCKTQEKLQSLIKRFRELNEETCLMQREIVHPFMYKGAKIDREALMAITKRGIELMDSYLEDQDVHDIMLHTIQPHIMWFRNKWNSLHEIYSDEDCLRSAQVLMMKEWLGVIGQLFVLTEDSLGKAEKMLVKEIT